jgi:hypothetical protein
MQYFKAGTGYMERVYSICLHARPLIGGTLLLFNMGHTAAFLVQLCKAADEGRRTERPWGLSENK